MERGPYRRQSLRFQTSLNTQHGPIQGGRRRPSLLPPCMLISRLRSPNGGECVQPNSLVDRQRDRSSYFGAFHQGKALRKVSCFLFLPQYGPLNRTTPLCRVHLPTEPSSAPLLVYRILSSDYRLWGHP